MAVVGLVDRQQVGNFFDQRAVIELEVRVEPFIGGSMLNSKPPPLLAPSCQRRDINAKNRLYLLVR